MPNLRHLAYFSTSSPSSISHSDYSTPNWLYTEVLQGFFRSKSVTAMHSCKLYLSMNIGDLRRELASRNLPTEGLKRDLTWRLASFDNTLGCRPLGSPPPASGSSPIISNGESILVEMADHNIQVTEFRNRTPKQSSPFKVDSSHSIHHDRQRSEKEHHISNSAPLSTAFINALIAILLMIFLSCILWHHTSKADKEYFSRSIDNGFEFLSLEINSFLDFIRSQF